MTPLDAPDAMARCSPLAPFTPVGRAEGVACWLAPVSFGAHPAALPPGPIASRYEPGPDWPPDWHGAARWLALPDDRDGSGLDQAPLREPVADAGPEVAPASARPFAPRLPAPPGQSWRRWRRLGAAAGCLILCVGAAGLAAWRRQAAPVEIPVSFKAPVMVLRASGDGMVARISVRPAQPVSPESVLLTLQVSLPPDPAAVATQQRVQVAKARVAALAAATPAQIAAPAASDRARLLDLRHERELADAELAAAQDALARVARITPTEVPVLAGVHGVILSLEAARGTATTAGTPLVRMADCDHGYVTLDAPSSLDPGSLVEIRLQGLAPKPATLRPASPVAQPGSSVPMVAEPAPGAYGLVCPLGASGVASPIQPAS